MGKHTKDALLYALTVLAPIFKIYRVFISGSTFNDNLKLIHEVQLELQAQASPVLSQIKLEYWDSETRNFMRELIYLSFDRLSEIIDPQPIKRDPTQILPQT